MSPHRPRAALALVALLAVGGAAYALARSPLVAARLGLPGSPRLAVAAATTYTCPMHPQIVQDHPGACPICHMDLVKKRGRAGTDAGRSGSAGTMDGTTDGTMAGTTTGPGGGKAKADELASIREVSLSPRQRVLANVATARVGRRALASAVEAVGRITYDERRLRRVSAWIGGRIERLRIDATGQAVAVGQVVAEIYSPELVSAEREYLTALAGAKEMRDAPYAELAAGAADLAKASRQRLALMGVTEAQLRDLEATRAPLLRFPIRATAAGVVVERKVQQGQYVAAGDALLDLAATGEVWLEAAVYELDLARIRPGMEVEARLQAFPGRVFAGRVEAVLPALDAATRTAKVRVALPNPRNLLRPDMYATARLLAPGGGGLAVPASAVIDSGKRRLVYVEAAPGRFEPRTLELGPKTAGWYPVVSGLREGEKVAVSGGFLLDASAELQEGDLNP